MGAMRILMVASEATPFASSGSLGEAVGPLARALVRQGHAVDLVMPRYRGITAGELIARIPVALGGLVADAGLHAAIADGVRVVFVDHPAYFHRDHLYGAGGHDYGDNAERFAFLCQAALSWALAEGTAYDIAHAHDWQA